MDENLEKNEQQSTPVFEEVEINNTKIKKNEKNYDPNVSLFDGSLIALIGYNILAFLITIVTLGIASPWAECMITSYKINHMVLNGKRLRFEGTGGSLFVNRLKWFLLTLITFGIYGLWIPIKKKKWELSYIHFEDEQLVSGESFFDGKMYQLLGINFICNVINVFTLGLLFPFTVCLKLKWLCKHSVINRKKLIFKGNAISLILHYFLWCFLTLITFGIFALWLNIKVLKWQVKNTNIKVVGEEYNKDKSIIWLSILGVFFTIILVVLAINFISNVPQIVDNLTNNSNDYNNSQVVEEEPEYQYKFLDIDNIVQYTIDFSDGSRKYEYSQRYIKKSLDVLDDVLSRSVRTDESFYVRYSDTLSPNEKISFNLRDTNSICSTISFYEDGYIGINRYECVGSGIEIVLYRAAENDIANYYYDKFH